MKKYLYIVGVIALLFIAFYFFAFLKNEKEEVKTEVVNRVKIDTLKIFDTIRIIRPILVKSTRLREDTISITKKAFIDSSKVVLPIEQKIYSDSSYTAFVSGYRAVLDSIHIRSPTTIINREIERVITQTKRKHFNIEIVGDLGYGFTTKKLSRLSVLA
jgi:hypothetical protein